MYTDYTVISRGVFRPVSSYTIYQVEFLSRLLLVGLALLWLSGAGIIWLNYLSDPHYITNQKLWAKIIIVAVLTLNGFAVHGIVLPHIRESRGRRLFDGVDGNDIGLMTLIGSFSLVSWVMPMVLAKATGLNYVTPVEIVLAVYAACVLFVWLALFAMSSSISNLQDMARRVAATTLQRNDPWEDEIVFPTSTLVRPADFKRQSRTVAPGPYGASQGFPHPGPRDRLAELLARQGSIHLPRHNQPPRLGKLG
jgi:hypothetical protein